MGSIPRPIIDESRWVNQVRKTIDEEHVDVSQIPVSIFSVPKTLMVMSPDCYVPQEVALGPYHHWRPELYEMEKYKLAAARAIQKQLQNYKFQNLVDEINKLEPMVRACYHKYLNFRSETLAWMMAVDAAFLLEFLQIYALKEGKLTEISSGMSHLVDVSGTKSAHNAILRDVVMLENQIPMFLLRKMLEFQFPSQDLADGLLLAMLIGLCKELSPLKMMEELPKVEISECGHLLDFLYHVIVPKLKLTSQKFEIEVEVKIDHHHQEGGDQEDQETFAKPSHLKRLLQHIWKILSKLNHGPVRLIKKLILSKPLKVLVKLPWTILSNLPGLKLLKEPIEKLFFDDDGAKEEEPEDENNVGNKPPSVEEISIPSVTDLVEAGVNFQATTGGLRSIKFDPKTITLSLPTIILDVNSEVIFRNLVAYEACNASGPLVFTRFTELMNGIIDTEEDAKILRERGIIVNQLKKDEDVANLWNGMSKSLKLTKVPFMDRVIEDVNKYYSGRWKVKAGNFMKSYVFGSWQLLTLVAAILMLLLMGLQSFCSVYTCKRIWGVTYVEEE